MMTRARIVFNVIYGLVAIAAGAVTVLQYWVPSVEKKAFENGKTEIAQEVVTQLSKAGFITTAATAALKEGNFDEAVKQITLATLAKPVAVAPDVPFELKEREVIDLKSGELVSWTLYTDRGSYFRIRLQAGNQISVLDIGEAMKLKSGCRLEYLTSQSEKNPKVANLRHVC